MKVFTIIKGQSERVPEKNFQELGGKPLWKHLLSELEGLDLYVNSDSISKLKAQGIDRLANITLIERDPRHVAWETDSSRQDSPVLSMLREFIETFVTDLDEVIVLTHVTSPFLKKRTLLDAAEFINNGNKSVHSVSSIRDFCWLESEDGTENHPLNFNPSIVQKTQNLPAIFASKGAFFIFRAKDFLETGERIISPCHFFELSHLEAVEIDYPNDIEFARQLCEVRI